MTTVVVEFVWTNIIHSKIMIIEQLSDGLFIIVSLFVSSAGSNGHNKCLGVSTIRKPNQENWSRISCSYHDRNQTTVVTKIEIIEFSAYVQVRLSCMNVIIVQKRLRCDASDPSQVLYCILSIPDFHMLMAWCHGFCIAFCDISRRSQLKHNHTHIEALTCLFKSHSYSCTGMHTYV